MLDRKRKQYLPALAVALLVAIAYSIRFMRLPEGWDTFALLTRAGIYLGLYTAWGFSVRRRIIQPQPRRMFAAIVAMMIFWMTVRTVKFLSQPSDLARYCWYLYYIPMLFIPLLTTLIAARLGRAESYRLPRWTAWLYAAAMCIALLVLTNDFHRLAFVFPPDLPLSDEHYSYGAGFVFPAVWRYGGLLATLGLVVARSRLPGRGKRLLAPVIPAILMVLYHLCYLLEFHWLRDLFGDLTATECLLVVCILECCLHTGLIPSNTRYAELFAAADLTALITDGDYHVNFVSRNAAVFPPELMRKASEGPVMVDRGTQLQSMALSGGHLLWATDLSDLLALQESLEMTREELADRNEALRHSYEEEQEYRRVVEQNRLYDVLQSKAQRQLDRIHSLVREYGSADAAGEKRRILSRIILLASYVKRRKDFVLSMDVAALLPESRLEHALAESYRALTLLGVRGTYLVDTERELLNGELLIAAYDFFEDFVEAAVDSLRCVNVIVRPVEGTLRISILADCGPRVLALEEKYPQAGFEAEEDGVTAVLPLEGGQTA